MSVKLALGGASARPVRDLDRQDARVPRAGVPRRCADARACSARSCCSCRGACDGRRPAVRRRASPGRRPGPGELHAALPGPHVRTAQRVRAARLSCWRSRWPGRRTSRRRRTCTSRRRSRCCSRRSSSRSRCTGSCSVSASTARIETVVGIGLTMLAGMGLVALVDRGHAAGAGRRRSARPRGSRLCAVGGAARPADDGHPAQCGEPGDRLHVAWRTA